MNVYLWYLFLSCILFPLASNCTYFKFFTTGENAVLFQKTTRKSESCCSYGLFDPLSNLSAHSLLSLFLFLFLFSTSPFRCLPAPSLPFPSSDALSLLFSPLSVVSPTIHPCHFLSVSLHLLAALFQVGHCLLCECLKSIPPTLRSSVSELPSNLSFHWQLYNVLRSHSTLR